MKNIIKFIVIRILDKLIRLKSKARFLLPITHKRFIKKRFLQQHGYNINFKNPVTLSEKIQWIKLYGSLEQYAEYVDKNEVRSYVKEKVGENYLIPKIGVYKNANDIELDLLPERFVIKATHGSGWNMIVKDKSNLNWNNTTNKIKKWINTNYFYTSGEKNYKNIRGRVIIEQLIDDPNGAVKEYKFYCYHGKPQYIMVVTDPYSRQLEFYDLNWNKLNMNMKGQPITNHSMTKPYHFEEMLDICTKLSNDFAFVRVDLYYSQGKIYVGELTFTSDNGFAKFSDVEFDRLFGSHLILPVKK
ncbi:ATP-grasp fold amidoligase family protein [Virgibacillus salinus]|uniref:TupA-like ATPgrasp n=1 Tax=Virgibacillus salinus TaxID=553311 RepID=A0A1H0Y426_9BACI|nr:ATP-grasp fold amidoligase family protein [Virgibacillus salinus]SDQ09919.1 TupA-like ATPgrasp [Virgibacillus salinus]